MKNLIEVKNLSKSYDKFELEGINFCVPAGSIVGFIGENGAGKTTTLKILADLVKPNGGEVSIFGKPHDKLEKSEKEKIGFVLGKESNGVMPNNLRGLSKYFAILYDSWDKTTFENLCKKFKLSEKKVSTMSSGEKMKLWLAVAFSHNSQLLILDEPVNGLDPYAREIFRDMLREFIQNEQNAVLISSHILSDLEKICDYILFIQEGKMVFFDSNEVLADKYAVLKCDNKELEKIQKSHILGLRQNAFGNEVLIERKHLPNGSKFDNPSIEEIMIFVTSQKQEVEND